MKQAAQQAVELALPWVIDAAELLAMIFTLSVAGVLIALACGA